MPHRIVFMHQNAPAQFRHLLAYCARNPAYEVAVVGEKSRILSNFPRAVPGLRFHVYEMADLPSEQVPRELLTTAQAMRRGRAAALCLKNMRDAGFRPDVIYGHPGWGDMMHVRDVFPDARVVNYCEFYFNKEGQDLDFDPEFQTDAADAFRVRTDNMAQLVSLIDADAGISPTVWQRSRYPDILRQHITVVHDGIDLEAVKPDPSVRIRLPQASYVLDRSVPVITYVSRNLEPYRGFHVFMRALPKILKLLPDAHAVILGNDGASYSRKLPVGQTYREMMLSELKGKLDPSRVHFLGWLPYTQYLRILQLSTVHVYLTYPFVLSWSMLEAMAAGAIVVGSRTPPVEEVIEDGVNGILVDFFSHQQLADAVVKVSEERDELASLREAVAATITQRFDLNNGCLSRQLGLLFNNQGVSHNEPAMV